MAEVRELDAQSIHAALEQEKPVLIDFWAPWCGPCRVQGPILHDVAKAIGEDAIVAKVNVDDEPELAAAFQVQGIPTLVVLKGKTLAKRFVGVQSEKTLVSALRAA
ncbi:MAG: thioredoxin [Acidobacteria bacterium]|nr:thioredoxin [Acidobacteriota bacterium]